MTLYETKIALAWLKSLSLAFAMLPTSFSYRLVDVYNEDVGVAFTVYDLTSLGQKKILNEFRLRAITQDSCNVSEDFQILGVLPHYWQFVS